MTDKKLTQKEVIKALECHIGKEPKRCELCPYTIYGCDCLEKLHFALYDLIKRLKTRIVRYQLKNTNQRNALASLNKKVAEQKAEIERVQLEIESCNSENAELKAEIERLQEELKITKAAVHDNGLEWGLISIKKLVDDTKTKAIKEFAERLKVLYMNDVRFYRKTKDVVEEELKRIDNLVKEMTEG